MADLVKMLTQVRDHYVDMFEAALQELREKGHTLIIEPPMVNEAGELAREGALNLGSRARPRPAGRRQRNAQHVLAQPKMLRFEPEAFHGAGLNIVVAPFQWDNVRIAIDGDAVKPSPPRWPNGSRTPLALPKM